jgi:hypothetical protein
MADTITIAGVRPYDGRYELDLDGAPLTTREWGWIKRFAGYLPGDLNPDTFVDPQMITVLALVAMRRAGTVEPAQVPEVWERFADVPFGSAITFEPGEQEADADGPPAGSSNGSSSTSGDSSRGTSARSDDPPSRTGSPPSATSASAPVTSAS